MNRTSQPDEWKLKELINHFEHPETRLFWDQLSTIDPMGMNSNIPTIAATPAIMEIPELIGKLQQDKKIVNKNQTVNVTKMAIEPVWNLAKMATVLHISEEELRQSIYKWTSNESILNP